MVRALEELMAMLYPGGHPYGRRTKGSIDIVERLTREDLERLHAERFAPSELTAAIVGDVDPAHAQAVAGRVFGDWKKPSPPPDCSGVGGAATTRERRTIPMMNKSQADVAYGFITIARPDPDYYAYWLMNVVFGQYAIGGRLGDSIRERQGMAYYASSSFDANVIPGPLVIRAGVSPANVDRAIASIDEEVVRLGRGRPDREGTRRVAPVSDWRACRARSRPTPRLPTSCSRRVLRSRPRLRRAPSGLAVARRHGRRCQPGPARRSIPSRDARHRGAVTLEGTDQSRFLRRRFHADLPRADVPGEGYRAFCARYGMTSSERFALAVPSAAPLLDGPTMRRTTPRSSSPTRAHIIEEMGGTGRDLDACAGRFTRNGRPANTSSCTTMCPTCCASWRRRHPHRPDLEFAPLPVVVPVALRARGPHRRDRLVVRTRLHEAASEHFCGGAAARRRRPAEAVMVGDSLKHDVDGALRAGMRGGAAAPRRHTRPRRGGARRAGDPLASRSRALAGARLNASRSGIIQARQRASRSMTLTYRDLTTLEEFATVVDLEREIWGPGYDEVVPVPILAITVMRGGILMGAFADRRMIGFVYSLPGIKDGKPTQWSHMLGRPRRVPRRRRRPGIEAAAARADAGHGSRPHRMDLRSDAGAERAPQLREARCGGRRIRSERVRRVDEPAAQRAIRRTGSSPSGGSGSRTSSGDSRPRRN